jgi:hypothetical protein
MNARRLSLPFSLFLAVASGCAGYQFGSRSLYRSDLRTVYVPIIQSDLFRRNFGERLTEAVIKEIELRTPYKVVHNPQADSVLTARIVSDGKRVLAENIDDDSRLLEVQLFVAVNWMDRYGNLLLPDARVPVSAFMLNTMQSADFIPEAGQSIATAHQDAIEELAQDIVNQMELRW